MVIQKEVNVNELSPLILAFMGDAVFEMLTREMIITQGGTTVNKAAARAKKYVNAAAQAAMYHKIYDSLTPAEQGVIRRGRNANSFSRAKNATLLDYRHATGLETLFGYLFLKGDSERINELFLMCVTEDKE